MRLIDADSLIGELHSQFFYDGRDRTRVYAKIQAQLTIDAEPIRHGHWIDDKIAFYRQCSECGANIRANLYEVFLDCDIRDLHYCPNCGTKMNEGDGR